MRIESLKEVKCNKIAVIVNCGTKALATLALLSSLRHLNFRPVVVDCESTDGSLEFFTELMQHYDFDLISIPLKRHGITLDWIFNNTSADWIALIDSDAEILDREYINFITSFVDKKNVFGMGFVHGPCWIKNNSDEGYYQERMWIPFSILNVEMVKDALRAGRSFVDHIVFNELSLSQLLSRIIYHLKKRSKTFFMLMSKLKCLRGTINEQNPAYIYCDTGSSIYQYLKHTKGFFYIGLPAELHKRYVEHHHGVTRKILDPHDNNATLEMLVIDQALSRIKDYQLEPELLNKLTNITTMNKSTNDR